jgi:hypothetical protein
MGLARHSPRSRGDDLPPPNPAFAHAMGQLREREIPASRIVAVDPWAITYLDQSGCVFTAWVLWLEAKEKLVVWAVPGLPAFP